MSRWPVWAATPERASDTTGCSRLARGPRVPARPCLQVPLDCGQGGRAGLWCLGPRSVRTTLAGSRRGQTVTPCPPDPMPPGPHAPRPHAPPCPRSDPMPLSQKPTDSSQDGNPSAFGACLVGRFSETVGTLRLRLAGLWKGRYNRVT